MMILLLQMLMLMLILLLLLDQLQAQLNDPLMKRTCLSLAGIAVFPVPLLVLMMLMMLMMALLYVEVPSSLLVQFLASSYGQSHAPVPQWTSPDSPGPPLPAGLSFYSYLPYYREPKMAAVTKHDAHALTLPNLVQTFLTSKAHGSKDFRVALTPILSGVKRA